MSPFTSFERFVLASFAAIFLAGRSPSFADPEVSFLGKAAVAEASEDKLIAMIQGMLGETEECLILSAEGGGDYLPVFPKGDLLRDDASNGYSLRGTPLSIEEAVSFGGGELTPPPDTSFGQAVSRSGVSRIWLVS